MLIQKSESKQKNWTYIVMTILRVAMGWDWSMISGWRPSKSPGYCKGPYALMESLRAVNLQAFPGNNSLHGGASSGCLAPQ